jgi:signal transduction histidine kinase
MFSPKRTAPLPLILLACCWGILLGWLFPQTPLQTVEFAASDMMIRLRGPQAAPADIVVVRDKGLSNPSPTYDRPAVAALVRQLFEAGQVRTVVLNLPPDFTTPLKLPGQPPASFDLGPACTNSTIVQQLGVDLDCPLRQVIRAYGDRMVLVTVPNGSTDPPRIEVYNHFQSFLPDAGNYTRPPQNLLGFEGFRGDPDYRIRRVLPTGIFLRGDSFAPSRKQERVQPQDIFLNSAETLAYSKFIGKDPPTMKIASADEADSQALFIRYLGPEETVKTINLSQVCQPIPFSQHCAGSLRSEIREGLRNKLVVVSVTDQDAVSTPFGPVARPEVQAQALAGYFPPGFYRRLGDPWSGFLTLGMAILGGALLTYLPAPRRWYYPLGLGLLALGYGLLIWGFLVGLGWSLPLFFPVMAMLVTGITAGGGLTLIESRQRALQQRAELERLRKAERQAVLNQARKLLYRVATDIHDNQLQELKLVMDGLEYALVDPKQMHQAIDEAISRLAHVGQGIRDELNDIRNVATKLEISPQLKQGLLQGLKAELQTWQNQGDLTLEVHAEWAALVEPQSSDWFDAREDIFRFFREALANATRHAQPPKGTATQLWVSLEVKNDQAVLWVENDGTTPPNLEQGNYGTKVMKTIASQLPQGTWQRIARPGGGVKVGLSWSLTEFQQTAQAISR